MCRFRGDAREMKDCWIVSCISHLCNPDRLKDDELAIRGVAPMRTVPKISDCIARTGKLLYAFGWACESCSEDVALEQNCSQNLDHSHSSETGQHVRATSHVVGGHRLIQNNYRMDDNSNAFLTFDGVSAPCDSWNVLCNSRTVDNGAQVNVDLSPRTPQISVGSEGTDGHVYSFRAVWELFDSRTTDRTHIPTWLWPVDWKSKESGINAMGQWKQITGAIISKSQRQYWGFRRHMSTEYLHGMIMGKERGTI